MPDAAGVARKHAALADLSATCNTRHSRQRRVSPDPDVVCNHAKIIDANTVFDDSVIDRAAVHGRIRSNLHVVADYNAAYLRHLDPPLRRHCVAESIGPEHDPGMENAALADLHGSRERHVGEQSRVIADLTVRTDHGTGSEIDMLADA